MEIRVRVVNPAGNITIFVMNPIRRTEYAWISRRLLEMEEFHAEQVGFVEKKEDGSMYMQMMGGEFCGNATRSFGYLLSMLDENKPKEVMVDVSGADRPLKTEVNHQEGTSRTQMPPPLEIINLDLKEKGMYSMVVFEGICHIIVESAPKDGGFVEQVLREARRLYDCDAYGIMFLEGESMTPVVYVKETDSLVWVSSCGSGSMGAAVYLFRNEKEGAYTCRLHQPGGVIEASVLKENGRVTECRMGGPVVISEEITVQINMEG